MKRFFLSGGARRIATATAGIVGLVALIAYAAGGGIVVDTGPGGGPAFHGTSGSDHGGQFEGPYGIEAIGTSYAGYFKDSDDGTEVYVAADKRGVSASATDMAIRAVAAGGVSSLGGWFEGDYQGIYAFGGSYGIEGKSTNGVAAQFRGNWALRSYGTAYGGYFNDIDNGSSVYLAVGDTGAQTTGADFGIYATSNSHVSSVAGYFDGRTGVQAYGVLKGVSGVAVSGVGGYFSGEIGIQAYGITGGVYAETVSQVGGEFHGETGVAGYGEPGVYGEGWSGGVEGVGVAPSAWGVRAENADSGAYVELPSGPTKSLLSNAPVGMVQNHPWDPGLVIFSSAPVGDEVATYTRGTATLEAGEAVVPLGEVFALTTNPDYGLTAHLTPVGGWADLYVAEKTTDQIVVRSRDSSSDAVFDYQVWGLRIGFEESPVMCERIEDAGLPMVSSHRDFNQRHPELARHTAAARFERIEAKAREIELEDLDLSRSEELEAAIGYRTPLAVRRAEQGIETGARTRDENPEGFARRSRREDGEVASRGLVAADTEPNRPDGVTEPDVFARSFQPSLSDLARYLDVVGDAEPGDVLVARADGSGMLQRSNNESDTAVVGVVASAPGLVLGSDGDGGDRRLPVVLMGIAEVKVDADYGPIKVGDLLITSPTPGHAMRDLAALPGTVLGKALQPLDTGRGTIQVLVTLR